MRRMTPDEKRRLARAARRAAARLRDDERRFRNLTSAARVLEVLATRQEELAKELTEKALRRAALPRRLSGIASNSS
jgi:hypothetical protein